MNSRASTTILFYCHHLKLPCGETVAILVARESASGKFAFLLNLMNSNIATINTIITIEIRTYATTLLFLLVP